MITWIQVLLQKHHKIIFSVLLFVIIIAFVFSIGSSIPFFGGGYGGESSATRKDFYGYNLEGGPQAEALAFQARLAFMFDGATPTNRMYSDEIKKQAYLLHLANSLSVGRVSDSEFKAYVHSLPAFKGPDGKFSPEKWKEFIDTYLKVPGMSEEFLNRAIAQLALVERMQNLVSGPGYVLTEEVKSVYDESNGKWDVAVAEADFGAFNPKIEADEAKLKTFYEANREAFRIPAAVAVDAVLIPASGFADDKEALSDADVEKHYRATMRKYLSFKDGQPEIKDLKDVRAEVEKDLRASNAVTRAFSKAEEVVMRLYDADAKFGSEEFKKLVAEEKLALKKLPFIRPDQPLPEGVPAEVAKSAIGLTAENFYCDPVVTDEGAWLVFFRESKDSYVPEFAEAKAAVEAAYSAERKAEAFSEMGGSFSKSAGEAVKTGGAKAFGDAAKAAGFKVTEIEKFSFADPAFRNASMARYWGVLKDALSKMKPGEVSPMFTADGKGFVVYASAFSAPERDDAKLKQLEEEAVSFMKACSASSVLHNAIGSEAGADSE